MSKKKADLKVVILGDMAIGKTTLIHRYIEGAYQDQISTIGASFSLKQWGPYNVAIWDTAGEERFSGLSNFYCRGAAAAILAYDVTSEDSFNSLRKRFMPLLDAANDDCLCIVVGTKADLLEGSQQSPVPLEDVYRLAKVTNKSRDISSGNMPVFETSALTGHNVVETFEYILETLLPLHDPSDSGDCAERAALPPALLPHMHPDVVDLEKPAPTPSASSSGSQKSGCCKG